MKLITKSFKNFLTSPDIEIKSNSKSLLVAYKQFFAFDIKFIFFFGILISLMSVLSNDFKEVFNNRISFDYPFFKELLVVVILAPLMEEISFRLCLKIKKINIAISFGVQLFYIFIILDVIDLPLLYNALFIILSSTVVYFLINQKILAFLKKHFKYFVYYNIIFFGLTHALNYEYSSLQQYFYIPILISFPTVLGAYLSYVRLKHGFLFVLSAHALHNLILFLLSSLPILFTN